MGMLKPCASGAWAEGKNPERKLRSLILEAEWLRELNCNSQAWITLHRIAGKPGSLGTNGLRG
jgi:hypothetical protein